ncbi:MAG: carbohydrate kinase family protein [Thermoguttaceae bacterium]
MSSISPHILAVGEVLWDLFPQNRQVGGAPGNFAFHCQQLGASTRIVSRIGNDVLGNEMLAFFQKHNLDISLVQKDADFPTGTVEIVLQNGIPQYTIVENVAWDHLQIDAKTLQYASEVDAICFGSLASRSNISGETIRTLVKAAKPEALRVCDINLRSPFFSKLQLAPILEMANILKLNAEELLILVEMFHCPETDTKQQARWFMQKYNYQLLVLTNGEQGSTLITPQEESTLLGKRVDVVDTVGAGDAFTAQTIFGILAGWSIPEIHQRANELAAFVCTQHGAMNSPPKMFSVY